MGDRANIFISEPTKENPKNGIYFYSHYGGNELIIDLKNALIRGKNRWDDSQYLNRIIFSEMIKNSVLDETGFGLSTKIGDNSYNIIVVNPEEKTVGLAHEGNEPLVFHIWSFENFVSSISGISEKFLFSESFAINFLIFSKRFWFIWFPSARIFSGNSEN